LHLVDVFILLFNQLNLGLIVKHPVPAIHEILLDIVLISSLVSLYLSEWHVLGNVFVEVKQIKVEQFLEHDACLGDIIGVAREIFVNREESFKLFGLEVLTLNTLLEHATGFRIHLLVTQIVISIVSELIDDSLVLAQTHV